MQDDSIIDDISTSEDSVVDDYSLDDAVQFLVQYCEFTEFDCEAALL